jgi:large conductance mechanosensitive channel
MEIFDGFKKFILRGNVVDLAVGVVIGSAFATLVNALVKDLLTPFIGAIAKTPDFSKLFFTINGSRFMYGELLNAIISFLLIATTVYFFVILPIEKLFSRIKRKDPVAVTTKKCKECLSDIPVEAKRCAFCGQPVKK